MARPEWRSSAAPSTERRPDRAAPEPTGLRHREQEDETIAASLDALSPDASSTWHPAHPTDLVLTLERLQRGRSDPTGFVAGHPVLDRAEHRHPGLRIPRSGRIMEALIPAILEQRVIGLQAQSAWQRLVRGHGTAAPGPAPAGMIVVPTVRAG